jgi:hypothetical protein
MVKIVTNTTLNAQLGKLVGLQAWGGCLAADMLTIQFGEERTVTRKDGPRTVGQMALHIQSPWRISKNGSVVVGQQDYFSADGEDEIHSVWDTVAQLLPDTSSEPLGTPTVGTVTIEPPAGILMTLEKNLTIQVFPCAGITARDMEAWRLFEPDRDDPHFVVMSDGSLE